MKRLPIKAAKELAEKYNQDQVILVTWDKKDKCTHTVSYGKTKEDCKQAEKGINFVRLALRYPPRKLTSKHTPIEEYMKLTPNAEE